jgi:TPR repeat protein
LHEERLPHEPVPLFLSTYEEESHQPLSEYAFASGHRKKVRVSRIVTAVVAVSAIGGLLALFSIDSTRAVIVNVRASLGGGAPAQFGAAEQEPAQASAQLPPRVAAPASPEPAAAIPDPDPSAARRTSATAVTTANALASASPSRDEITAAYQSAIKGKVAVPEPVAREAAREAAPVVPAVRETVPPPREAVPARRIDPDELAALLKRAKGLLAIGDITSARLLLERAADAQEPEAALMLAGTYDPQVLGSQDMRSVTPDPAAARVWYQKAAQLGSADAKRRLGQLQN